MGHMCERTNIQLILEDLMDWWFAGQADISQLETAAMDKEGETKMVV